MSRSSSTVSGVVLSPAGLIQSWRGLQLSHQESVQVQRFYERVEAFVLNFSQFRVFRTTQNLVCSDRNVLFCSGVIALEDSSGLASFSAWTLLDKMNHSFLSSLAQTTGADERFVVRRLVVSPSPVFRLCRFPPELEYSARGFGQFRWRKPLKKLSPRRRHLLILI
jgi:hypothetical protein